MRNLSFSDSHYLRLSIPDLIFIKLQYLVPEQRLCRTALNGQIINVTTGPIMADGIWKWMANPNSNIQIRASGITRVLSIPLNRSVEIQNLDILGGTATAGSAIDNSGTLELKNTDLLNLTGSTSITLRNAGNVTIEGNCDIRQ